MNYRKLIFILLMFLSPSMIYANKVTESNSKKFCTNELLLKDFTDYETINSYLDKSISANYNNGPIKRKNGNFGKRVKKRNQYNRNLKLKRYDNKSSGINIKWPFAVKTNLLYGGALTPNLAIEVPFKKKFSIELSSTYNAWDRKDNVKWKNLMVIPEFRYWVKDNTSGQFFGAHIGWAKYNIGGIPMPYFADANYYRYDGWAIGLGLSAGYKWQITSSFSTEVNIGVGVIYTEYDKYLAPKCGPFWGSFKNILISPTKVGFSLIYMFQ